jgi:hypothetical protein
MAVSQSLKRGGYKGAMGLFREETSVKRRRRSANCWR